MNRSFAALIAGGTGFLSLSYEILWVRVYAFATSGEATSFGEVLGTYLAGIAIGAFVARRYCGDSTLRRETKALWIAIAVATGLAFGLIPMVAELARHLPTSAALPLFGLVAATQGAVLPLLAHAAIPPDHESGARLARLFLANIAGCAAGSLLTGFVLMDELTLSQIAALLAASGFVLSGFCALGSRDDRAANLAIPGLMVVGPLLAFATSFDFHEAVYEKLQLKAAYTPDFRFIDVIETKSGVITVTPDRTVFGGGAYDGSFNLDPISDENGILRAYAIAAMHPAPREVLLIGLGSGAWAKVLAQHPALRRLTVIEINPGYVELVRRNQSMRSLLEDPKVEIIFDDGRRWLHRNQTRFDAIVQNTTHHWRAHVTNLLSKEYLDLIRDHLLPGGVYHSNSTGALEFLKTAASLFPHARRFRSFVCVGDSPLNIDPLEVEVTLRSWRIDGRFAFPRGDAAATARILEILGAGDWEDRASMLARTAANRTITDDNMATEFR